MPRFEDPSSDRFWEIQQQGSTLVRRFGKGQGDGRRVERDYASALAARWHAGELSREKQAEGYQLVDAVDGGLGAHAPVPGRSVDAELRAELARVQRELYEARGDKAPKLQSRQESLLSRHGAELLGDLAPLTDLVELEWRAGLIDHARVGLAPRRVNTRTRVKQLLPDVPLYQALRLLVEELCALDSARALRAVTLFSLGSVSFEAALAALADGAPATLRELAIANTSSLRFTVGLRRDREGDQEAGAELGEGVVLPPSVTGLRVEPPLAGGQLAVLCGARAPALERLSLSCGGAPSHSVADLEPLLAATSFPALTTLALHDVPFHAELCEVLCARPPLLAHLRRLELHGGFDDDDAIALAESGALAALEQLDVHNTQIGPDGVAALEQAGITLRAEDRSEGLITIEQVRKLSPDKRAEAAARSVAQPGKWQQLGRSAGQLWGLCQGRSPYEVSIELPALRCRCDCPSRKRPCKHALALLLLAVDDQVPRGDEAPDWVPQLGQRENWLDDPDDPPF
ncbi:MAG: SWIM zinc finger family protein [Myxococcales bacterium]|nr:SWIM zinc finger family protein [Myxococcales bacterium]